FTINVVSSIVVTVSPSAASLAPGAAQQFQAAVSGTSNTAVTWKVNGTVGGDSVSGTITANGLYTAPGAIPASGSVTVSALSQADNLTQGSATVTFQDAAALTYGRLLDQTSFGATPQSITRVRQLGIPAFIDEQLAMPESSWPALSTAQRSDAVDAFLLNAATGQDQLRQRVIYALSEIFVISMNKNTNGDELVPWL